MKQIPILPLKYDIRSQYLGHLPYLKELGKIENDKSIGFTIFKNKFRFYDQSNSRVFRLMFPRQNVVMCSEPEFYKEVLGTKQKVFSSNKNFKLVFKHFFPNAVIVVEGEKWQKIRKVIQNAINKASIEPIISVVCNIVENHLEPETINNSYTYDIVSQITFDTFNTVMYGWDPKAISGSIQSNFILRNCEVISHAIGNRALQSFPFLWKIPTFENLRVDLAASHLKKFTRHFIQNKNDFTKLKVDTQGSSLLEELITAASKEEDKLTTEELYDQISGIFFAAFDTTSNTLRYMLYYLAKYPEYQEKLRKELYENFPKGLDDIKNATSTSIESISSLSNFIDEVNRLNPLIPHIGRYSLEDTEVMGFEVKKGWLIVIDSHAVGQDIQYWKGQTDLKQFRPERWNEHRPTVLNSVLPFGFGGRVCPGRRIALLEIKSFISALLTKYRVTLRNSNDKLELETSIGVTIKKKACNINISKLEN